MLLLLKCTLRAGSSGGSGPLRVENLLVVGDIHQCGHTFEFGRGLLPRYVAASFLSCPELVLRSFLVVLWLVVGCCAVLVGCYEKRTVG